MTKEEIREWVHAHVAAPIGSKSVAAVWEWGEIVANRFYNYGISYMRDKTRQQAEMWLKEYYKSGTLREVAVVKRLLDFLETYDETGDN